MRRDELRELLTAWGHATVNRYAYSRADHSRHVLGSNLRDLKAIKPASEERELVKRDGRSRRLYMAAKIQCGLTVAPLWSCDPAPARNDADRPHDNPEIAVDMGIPDDLRWIDAAVRRIERQDSLRGLVLRTEFTVSASQKVKARMVAETYGGKFSRDMYRRELDKAMELILWDRKAA